MVDRDEDSTSLFLSEAGIFESASQLSRTLGRDRVRFPFFSLSQIF